MKTFFLHFDDQLLRSIKLFCSAIICPFGSELFIIDSLQWSFLWAGQLLCFSLHFLTQLRYIEVDSYNGTNFLYKDRKLIKNLEGSVIGDETYINGISRCLMPKPNGISRNAQHGRQGSEPSESMSPPWERIIEIFDRCEFNQVEDEHALGNKNGNSSQIYFKHEWILKTESVLPLKVLNSLK